MKKCYPYLSGVLESKIRSLSLGFSVPGIEITDRKKFEEYLLNEIRDAEKMSIEYAAANPDL